MTSTRCADLLSGQDTAMSLGQSEGAFPHACGPVHLHTALPVPTLHKVLFCLLESSLTL